MANFERNLESPESLRKGELRPVVGVDVVDTLTARIRLSTPYAPLLSLLANRPGIMMSPAILGKTSGGDRGTPGLRRAVPLHRTRRAGSHRARPLPRTTGTPAPSQLDRIVFQPIVDPTVRLVNLRSGALDIGNRMSPTDVAAIKGDPQLRLVTSPSIGFQLLSFNINHPPGSATPLARDPRVREAFEKSLDRAIINQVAMDGQYLPNNQTEPPGTRYWDPDHPGAAARRRRREGAAARGRDAARAHSS